MLQGVVTNITSGILCPSFQLEQTHGEGPLLKVDPWHFLPPLSQESEIKEFKCGGGANGCGMFFSEASLSRLQIIENREKTVRKRLMLKTS